MPPPDDVWLGAVRDARWKPPGPVDSLEGKLAAALAKPLPPLPEGGCARKRPTALTRYTTQLVAGPQLWVPANPRRVRLWFIPTAMSSYWVFTSLTWGDANTGLQVGAGLPPAVLTYEVWGELLREPWYVFDALMHQYHAIEESLP